MSCGSSACTSKNYLETASPSFPGRRWSWQIPLAWLAGIVLWCGRRYELGQLVELDDRLLADIGISRQQAVDEEVKSSWTRFMP